METILVRVASYCRIVVDGRFALIVDLNRLKRREQRLLVPIGSEVKTTDAGIQQLIKEVGVAPTAFEKGFELLLHLSKGQLPAFKRWLETTAAIEADPAAAAFYAQAVMERNFLTSKLAGQVEFSLRRKLEGPTRLLSYRSGALESIEAYVFERVYNASVPLHVVNALVQATRWLEPRIELVDQDEIRNGRSQYGSEISKQAQLLLP